MRKSIQISNQKYPRQQHQALCLMTLDQISSSSSGLVAQVEHDRVDHKVVKLHELLVDFLVESSLGSDKIKFDIGYLQMMHSLHRYINGGGPCGMGRNGQWDINLEVVLRGG